MEIHERYEYDETSRPRCERVLGLIALCPDCHAVKHLARTQLVAREQCDPTIYENALRHLAQDNAWEPNTCVTTSRGWRRVPSARSAGKWTQDFSPLLGTDP